MIDMSKLYEHQDYEDALNSFNSSRCEWSLFINVHKKITNDRCPICECKVDNSVTRASNNGETTIGATIDHYRPRDYYEFLECNDRNYLLMCSDCNNVYKGNKFPLYQNGARATNEDELDDERPLIVNPITDDLLELFTLVFRQTTSGKKVLELAPKQTSGYLYEKALETIKVFGLGDCENNIHSSQNVHNCRITILESHYGVFYDFANALKNGDKKEVGLILKRRGDELREYGFYSFLVKKQFEV